MTAANPQQFVHQHRRWLADPRQLALIRAEVRSWLASARLGEDLVDDLVMAVSEAASNAMEHAYRPVTAQSTVELTLVLDQGNIDIEIIDHGRWQPPTTCYTGRGRGITLIRGLVDSVTIQFDSEGTRVLLHHQVPPQDGVTGIGVHRHDHDHWEDDQETPTG